jgi:hypothetical protein
MLISPARTECASQTVLAVGRVRGGAAQTQAGGVVFSPTFVKGRLRRGGLAQRNMWNPLLRRGREGAKPKAREKASRPLAQRMV